MTDSAFCCRCLVEVGCGISNDLDHSCGRVVEAAALSMWTDDLSSLIGGRSSEEVIEDLSDHSLRDEVTLGIGRSLDTVESMRLDGSLRDPYHSTPFPSDRWHYETCCSRYEWRGSRERRVCCVGMGREGTGTTAMVN